MAHAVAIGVAVVVLGVTLGYKFFTRDRQVNEPVVEKEMVEEDRKRTLRELMAAGGDVKCSFSYSDEVGGATEGEVYVSGEKSRSNYVVSIPEEEDVEGSMITDGEYSYVWGSSMEGGIKMKLVNEEVNGGVEEATVTSEYVKPDQEMDYRCEVWIVDPAVFTPPSEVNFRDLNAMMDEAKSSQCGACESLDGEARTSCKEQLGC